MNKSPVRYSETQPFPFALCLTGAVCALYVGGNMAHGGCAYLLGEPRFYLVFLLLASPAVFWGAMNVRVTDEGLDIGFGLLPFRRRTVPLAGISNVTRADIKWFRDFKFVGTANGRDTRDIGYFVRYGSGVRLGVGDGTLFIGSRRADELSRALKAALREARRSDVAD